MKKCILSSFFELFNNPIVSMEKNIFFDDIRLRNSSMTNSSIGNKVYQLIIEDGILETIDLSDTIVLDTLDLSSNHT